MNSLLLLKLLVQDQIMECRALDSDDQLRSDNTVLLLSDVGELSVGQHGLLAPLLG